MSIKNTAFRSAAATAVLACLFAGHAAASDLVFQGQNAALFPGANPSDTTALMNSVPKPSTPVGSTPNQSLGSLVQAAVENQISSQIYNNIFNGSATSGYYNLGGGSSISFTRSGGYVYITFVDPVNGTTTITVPDA